MNKINLAECKLNKEYFIVEVDIENEKLKKHLEHLFIKKGERISIIKKSYKSKAYIVKVLGINYAIELSICLKVFVYDI